MKTLLLILSVITMVFSSCSEEELAPEVITDPALAATLKASPESVTVGGNVLTLATYLWRDFMPGTGTNKSNLSCVAKLTEQKNAPIETGVILTSVFVVRGDEIWSSRFSEVRRNTVGVLEGVARNGPAWEADDLVDVVVEFEAKGQSHKIIARGQRINATY